MLAQLLDAFGRHHEGRNPSFESWARHEKIAAADLSSLQRAPGAWRRAVYRAVADALMASPGAR